MIIDSYDKFNGFLLPNLRIFFGISVEPIIATIAHFDRNSIIFPRFFVWFQFKSINTVTFNIVSRYKEHQLFVSIFYIKIKREMHAKFDLKKKKRNKM